MCFILLFGSLGSVSSSLFRPGSSNIRKGVEGCVSLCFSGFLIGFICALALGYLCFVCFCVVFCGAFKAYVL
jgi:hypothetical protein